MSYIKNAQTEQREGEKQNKELGEKQKINRLRMRDETAGSGNVISFVQTFCK